MSSLFDDAIAHRALQRIGMDLCGRYRILRLLGIGGMAAVYAGVHRNGHAVAIKVLHERLSTDPEVERFFRREAQLANKIQHPGIVPVIDDDVAEDGCTFLVMPLLGGETIRARAQRNRNKLPPEEVVLVAHEVLGILKAAHEVKIVHRDIKPENLYLTENGGIRVLDFGIARFFETNDMASVTRSGRALGTPAFMAPEQALGRIREIDGRTDLWALGASMFTLLVGKYVHDAESSSEALVFAATKKAPRLHDVEPTLPTALCDVIDRALAFERESRWSDAGAMDEALVRACESAFQLRPSKLPRLIPQLEPSERIGDATTQRPPPASREVSRSLASLQASHREPPFTRDAHRPRAKWLALGAVVLALAGGIFFGWRAYRFRQVRIAESAAAERAGELATHLAASRNAWLDGNFEKARLEAGTALRIDDTSGDAHLAVARTSLLWPSNEDRAEFIAAQETRRGLTPESRSYLEALAPGMAVPANFALSATRLEALHERRPGDVDVTIALAQNLIRTEQLEKAMALLQPLANSPDAEGVVLAFLGIASSAHDDVDRARETFQRCLANFPAASVCAWFLSHLELLEGNCAAAERIARQNIEGNPTFGEAYFQLANALESLGADRGEIRRLLAKRAALRNDPQDGPNRLYDALAFALYEGRLREGLDIDAKIAARIEQMRNHDGDDRASHYFTTSIMLKWELGMADAARESLATYTQARHTLRRSPYYSDDIMFVSSYAAAYGLIPWDDWKRTRESHLARPSDRDSLLDGRQRIWLEYFAMPAHDAEGANEALQALPNYLPFLHRSDRWPDHDRAIGNVFRLTGRTAEAAPYFARAIAGCTWLADPLGHVHALLEFGDLFASTGDRKRACAQYDELLRRWPVSTGSRSSMLADRHRAELCSSSAPSPRRRDGG